MRNERRELEHKGKGMKEDDSEKKSRVKEKSQEVNVILRSSLNCFSFERDNETECSLNDDRRGG